MNEWLSETEECDFRMVRCTWRYEDGKVCAAQVRAVDRNEHRDYHLELLGVVTFSVAGTYTYKVPKGIHRLKMQLWGGGGGSGYGHLLLLFLVTPLLMGLHAASSTQDKGATEVEAHSWRSTCLFSPAHRPAMTICVRIRRS